ncbi:hypothetical protein BpHYR1_027730 [Brachionus plicatilis]|uniref:Uncharacterized protein n=1 Tax=Brachionus plicatilis TaxID=10195 RepID=A0A3M7SKW1_BRAPC|nr:hypothetical protein BpHYR1_027730 [Brachionus plicatilis]
MKFRGLYVHSNKLKKTLINRENSVIRKYKKKYRNTINKAQQSMLHCVANFCSICIRNSQLIKNLKLTKKSNVFPSQTTLWCHN